MKERGIVLGKNKLQLNTPGPVKLLGRCFMSGWCIISLLRKVPFLGNFIAIPTVLWKWAGQNSTWFLCSLQRYHATLASSVFQRKSYWLALILLPFFYPPLIETCRNCSIILLGSMPGLWAPNYPGCLICPLMAPAQDLLLSSLKFPWYFEIQWKKNSNKENRYCGLLNSFACF